MRIPPQVHRATLHSGEAVAVKVQRPGLPRLFDIDLAILQGLAAQLDAQVPICSHDDVPRCDMLIQTCMCPPAQSTPCAPQPPPAQDWSCWS